jgi:shikimate dehydrogenase
MKKAAVLGHPISHSLSPVLHGYWLKQHGIAGTYEALDTPPEKLAETLKSLQQQGYSGVNLTVPLKTQILPLLDSIDETAQRIGAVNTVTFTSKGLHGTNTDAYGFIENLRASVGDLTPYLSHAVVLGAGGAARAVVAALLDAGVQKLTIINRSREKAEQLVKEFRIQNSEFSEKPPRAWILDSGFWILKDWHDRSSESAETTLLINTTSLGMSGQPPLEIDLSALPPHALVTDIVYKPLVTPLLQQAQARGLKTVDGLGMLLYQAQLAFEAFFGTRPAVTPQLRAEVLSRC